MWEKIYEVNQELKGKGIPVKDKSYILINDRVIAFRKIDLPDSFIRTSLISDRDGECIFCAEVGYYSEGQVRILATGHAKEKEGSTFINKTSYLENCETSAIGRALGMLGIGIEVSIASYEEVANARLNQEKEENDKLFKELIDQQNKLGQLEIDRKSSEFIQYVNEKAGTNFPTLEVNLLLEYPEDAKKISKVLKAIIKAKTKEVTKLDVKDETPTY